MDYAKAIYPDEKYDYAKHAEFTAECWCMQSRLDQAREKERNGNPFAMLRVDPACRPFSELEFELYLSKQKNYISGVKK